MDMQQFHLKVEQEAEGLAGFLEQLVLSPPLDLEEIVEQKNEEVWTEINCRECANCCKTMTPHYTEEDVERIATYLNLSGEEFKRRHLLQYSNGDWVNLSYPCSFLGEDNNCTIYEIRPQDCAGFPHHNVHPFSYRKESYTKNIRNCPATFSLVDKLRDVMSAIRPTDNS